MFLEGMEEGQEGEKAGKEGGGLKDLIELVLTLDTMRPLCNVVRHIFTLVTASYYN